MANAYQIEVVDAVPDSHRGSESKDTIREFAAGNSPAIKITPGKDQKNIAGIASTFKRNVAALNLEDKIRVKSVDGAVYLERIL